MGSERNSLPLQGAPPLASGYRSAGVEQCSTKSLHYLKQRSLLYPFSALHKRQCHSGWQVNINSHYNFKIQEQRQVQQQRRLIL